jgi:bifunctional non-homologous end joining protein LigD
MVRRGQDKTQFTEWTPDGYLRHSKFVGLRDDKAARDVEREYI